MSREAIIKGLEDDLVRYENDYQQSRVNLKITRRKLMYLKTPDEFYVEQFFSKRHAGMRKWEMKLGKALAERFKITSMVDFGCALGSYMEGALEGGCEKVLGFDLMYDSIMKWAPENMKPFIKHGNAGTPIECGKWDCVLSVEVAEHLIEEEADIFVDNLIKASSRLIIVTASNAGGRYHLNRQLREYWVGKFVMKGCKYSHKGSALLYRLWSKLGCPGYILRHIMVFTI